MTPALSQWMCLINLRNVVLGLVIAVAEADPGVDCVDFDTEVFCKKVCRATCESCNGDLLIHARESIIDMFEKVGFTRAGTACNEERRPCHRQVVGPFLCRTKIHFCVPACSFAFSSACGVFQFCLLVAAHYNYE